MLSCNNLLSFVGCYESIIFINQLKLLGVIIGTDELVSDGNEGVIGLLMWFHLFKGKRFWKGLVEEDVMRGFELIEC